jgi:hypothetical protein
MSAHWWRAYDEAVDSAKLCLLSDKAHRAWFNLMCLASAYEGVLPSMDVCSLKLRMPAAKVKAVLAELEAAQLFDQSEGKWTPHNWGTRQYKSDVSTERVKRFRNAQRNVSSSPAETFLELTRVQTTDSVSKETDASASPDPKKELFKRGREVLGQKSGALISKVLKTCGDEDDPRSIAKARAHLETASTKAAPVEWIGRIISQKNGGYALLEGQVEGIV